MSESYATDPHEYRTGWDDSAPVEMHDGEIVNPPPNPHGIRFAPGALTVRLTPDTAAPPR